MPQDKDTNVTRRNLLLAAGAVTYAGIAQAAGIDLAPPDRQPPDLEIPAPPSATLGYAIVGLGELALGQVLPAFAASEHCRPVALVSGHPDKAHKVARHYEIDERSIYNYDNYDSIRDNPAIDVVYVILPNSMHAEFTIRALEAGKHVLCEKPMCVSIPEAEQMILAGRKAHRKLMIAYRLRYEPFNIAMIEMAQQKKFGPVRLFEAANVQQVNAPNIRLAKSLGGGPLMDVGIYCVNAARYITGEEPVETTAMQFQPPDEPRFGEVPDRVAFQLRFPSGIVASCTCGFSSYVSRRYRVFCDRGWMELDPAFGYTGQRLRTSEGSEDRSVNGEIVMQPLNHFASEMDQFARCIHQDKDPITPGEEGLADMRVLTAIQKAADSSAIVQIT